MNSSPPLPSEKLFYFLVEQSVLENMVTYLFMYRKSQIFTNIVNSSKKNDGIENKAINWLKKVETYCRL